MRFRRTSVGFGAALLAWGLQAVPAAAQDAVTAPSPAPVTEAAPAPVTSPAPATTASAAAPAVFDEFSDFSQLDLNELLNASVESASGKRETISRAPAIIDVLTREQLLALGARDLYTALTYLPGIELVETFNGKTILIFRGMTQEQYSVKTLFLINGYPYYQTSTFLYLLEQIPIEAVDRIEVIRGPGSVLYGTNAFAGVIHVITRRQRDEGLGGSARLQAGQFTTFNGGAGTTGRFGGFDFGVFAGGESSRGFPYVVKKDQDARCTPGNQLYVAPPNEPYECKRAGDEAGRFEYGSEHLSAIAHVGYEGLRLQAGGLFQDKAKFGSAPTLSFQGDDQSQMAFGELSWERAFGPVRVDVRGGVTNTQLTWELRHFPTAAFPETSYHSDSMNYRAEAGVAWDIVDTLTLDQGLSYERADGNAEISFEDGRLHPLAPQYDDLLQTTASWYGQLTWNLTPELSGIGGLRLSSFETTRADVFTDDAGIVTPSTVSEDPILLRSPRAGLIYAPLEALSLKLLYGEAFRLPNPFEKHVVISRVIAPLPELKPETIRTFELGVDARPAQRVSVRANGHYSLLSDVIAPRLPASAAEEQLLGGPGSGAVYDNYLEGTIYGVEGSVQAVATDGLTLFTNAAYKHVAYESENALYKTPGRLRRTRMAPVTVNGGLSWTVTPWSVFRPNAQYVGARGYAKAFVLGNLVADFTLWEPLVLSLVVNNVAGAAYEYPEYVRRDTETVPGGPGRAFYGRATYDF